MPSQMKTTDRNYWLDLFTGQTWQEFLKADGAVSGFREGRWTTVQKIKIGDFLICYLTGLSRFIGVLEVVGSAYKDSSSIWEGEDFPCRVKVKPVITLPLENAIPVRELADRFSFAASFEPPLKGWTGHFRGSPAKWKVSDGEAVLASLLDAQQNPINRPFDAIKLKRKPKALKAKIGSVTVPEIDEPTARPSIIEVEKEATSHTEIQWLLLKLGNDMGLDVWVARNDRNRQYNNNQFNKLQRIKSELPLQFDEATNKTIELIDVLWLKGNSIAAAFEIESTTSIYSGLLSSTLSD